MKLLVLYRPGNEYARVTEEFLSELKRRYSTMNIEIEDVDSPAGTHLVEIYDLLHDPALIALAEDGSVLNIWEGTNLPLIGDVASYLNSNLP